MVLKFDFGARICYTDSVTREATNMTAKEMTAAEAIRELMNKWDTARPNWIARFGTDEGFAEWFSKQLGLEVA